MRYCPPSPWGDRWVTAMGDPILPVSATLAAALMSRAGGHPVLAANLLHRLVHDPANGLEAGRWSLRAGAGVPELVSDDELPAVVAQERLACPVGLTGLASLRRRADDTAWSDLRGLGEEEALPKVRRRTDARLLR